MRTALLLSLLAPTLVAGHAPRLEPTQDPSGPAAIVLNNTSALPLTPGAEEGVATAVAVWNDLALVGAPNTPGSIGEARVYAFRRDPVDGWVREQTLPDPLSGEAGSFGASVALRGTVAVVGAPRRVVSSNTVGAAYVYAYDPTATEGNRWSRQDTFPTSEFTGAVGRAGTSVAISDAWIAIGAPNTGDVGRPPGRVIVTPYSVTATGVPVFEAATTLVDPEADRAGLFGASVSVAQDVLAVGAPGRRTGAGSAETYSWDASSGSWMHVTPALVSPTAGAGRFGASVALAPDASAVVVGAPNASGNAGAAYVFDRGGSMAFWLSSAPVTLDTLGGTRASDYFGSTVATDGSLILVGAPNNEPAGMSADLNFGRVFAFDGRVGSRQLVAQLEVSTSRANEHLGSSIALSGSTLLAGAPSTGANEGRPFGGMGTAAGITFVFPRPTLRGEACDVLALCETGVCVGGDPGTATSVCCESACTGECQEPGMCSTDGACVPVMDGTGCTTACGSGGTCRSGACVMSETEMCDAGPPDAGPPDGGPTPRPEAGMGDDAGPFDAGPRTIVRISGCKCGVGAGRGPGPLGLSALSALGLLLAVRRRRGARALAAAGLVLLASSLALPPAARAQEATSAATSADAAPSDAELQTLLTEALREFEGGNYTEAYALFRRLHELAPSARTERGLGNTAFELRRYVEAIDWLEQSLTDTRRPLTDELRAQVGVLLLRARAFVGHFTIRANVAEAQIAIDGEPLAGEARSLEVGEHALEARAAGYETLTRRITVRGGEDETLELTLIPTPVSVVGGGGPAAPVDDPGAIYRDLGLASLVAGGAGVVGGAVATAFWASNVSALNTNIEIGLCDADPVTENVIVPPGTMDSTCLAQQSRYRLALPFVWVGFGAGVAFLGAGLGLLVGAPSATSGEGTTEGATSLRCGPFGDVGVSCTGTF